MKIRRATAILAFMLMPTLAEAVPSENAPATHDPSRTTPSDNFTIAGESPAMNKAIARARASLPEFLERAEHPPHGTDNFAIKYGLKTPQGVEYIWASFIRRLGERVLATVDVDVRWADDVKDSDPVIVEIAEVIDWMYMDGDRMIGNATLCALEVTNPSRQARRIIQQLQIDCAWLAREAR